MRRHSISFYTFFDIFMLAKSQRLKHSNTRYMNCYKKLIYFSITKKKIRRKQAETFLKHSICYGNEWIKCYKTDLTVFMNTKLLTTLWSCNFLSYSNFRKNLVEYFYFIQITSHILHYPKLTCFPYFKTRRG